MDTANELSFSLFLSFSILFCAHLFTPAPLDRSVLYPPRPPIASLCVDCRPPRSRPPSLSSKSMNDCQNMGRRWKMLYVSADFGADELFGFGLVSVCFLVFMLVVTHTPPCVPIRPTILTHHWEMIVLKFQNNFLR